MDIIIDAGHGGVDSGANGKIKNSVLPLVGGRTKEYYERDINLAASYILAGLLSRKNDVLMTRTTNRDFVKLPDRVKVANDSNAGKFISIHCNAALNEKANGFEIYHYPGSKGGINLANSIWDSVKSRLTPHGDPIKSSHFFVLQHTKMPAILIELGFMTNEQDLKNLIEPRDLFEIMRLISLGVK